MKFKITDRINDFFVQCNADSKLTDDLIMETDMAMKKGYISINLLTKLNQSLNGSKSIDIKDLLKGSSLVFEDNKPKTEASLRLFVILLDCTEHGFILMCIILHRNRRKLWNDETT